MKECETCRAVVNAKCIVTVKKTASWVSSNSSPLLERQAIDMAASQLTSSGHGCCYRNAASTCSGTDDRAWSRQMNKRRRDVAAAHAELSRYVVS